MLLRFGLLAAFALLARTATAQVIERFDAPKLDPAWVKTTSARGSIEIKDGWATFSALPGEQAHLARPAGEDLIAVSAWLARWAAVYLVWDEHNWCGVGKTSPTPFGRFTTMDVRGGKATEVDHRGIDFNGRHRVRLRLGQDHIAFQYLLDGKWVDLRRIERPKEFAGAPKWVVAGQAYLADGKPFGASGSTEAHFKEKPSGAIDELRIEPTPMAERKLTAAQLQALRHPPAEPVSALLHQNQDDPTYEKLIGYYPPFRFPREVVGVPEHAQEIGVDWLGRLDASPWAPPRAWFLVGDKAIPFGQSGVPFRRRLLDGYLPLVTLGRNIEGDDHELTVFGWSEGFQVDRPLFAYVRFRSARKVALVWGDGDKRRDFPGPVCYLRFRWPEPATVTAINAAEFDAKFREAAEKWRKRLTPAMRFDVPDRRVMEAYRAWIAYSLLNTDTIKGHVEPHDGSGFYEEMFGCSVSVHTMALDRYGMHDYAARILDTQIHFQDAEGLYTQACGLTDPGAFLAGLASHYRVTGDRDWLRRVSPSIRKQCDWLIRQRKAAPKDGTMRGLIKFRPYNDYQDLVYNYLGNAWCAQGMQAAAQALKEIGSADGERYAVEAARYRRDVLDSMEAAALTDRGQTLLPMEPDSHRLLKMSKHRGGDYYGLVASSLLETNFLPPRDKRATWIVDALEKRGGLLAGLCEFQGGIDHAYSYGYLMNALKRDEVRKTLLGFWGMMAFGMTRDTYSPVEVTQIATGENHYTLPHLYSCTEQLRLLRNLLLREEGDVLWIGQGIPRAWLARGKHVTATSAPSEFGEVSFSMRAERDGTLRVHLDPPKRRAPEEIRLRLRHPERRSIAAVDAAPRAELAFSGETIRLRDVKAPVDLVVRFKQDAN